MEGSEQTPTPKARAAGKTAREKGAAPAQASAQELAQESGGKTGGVVEGQGAGQEPPAEKAPARQRSEPQGAPVTPTARTQGARSAARAAEPDARAEAVRVKQELDRSNAVLRRLLRELDERGPNNPSVRQIWESVRQAATTSDQLIQRLDRLRAEIANSE